MHDIPANGYNPPANNGGEAYLFNAATGTLTTTLGNPFPGAGDRFGASVASVAGNALVGAPVNDAAATSAGAAYLFDDTTGMLVQIFVRPGPLVSDEFGYAVAALGSDKVVVSARRDDTGALNVGAVHVFDVATGALLQTFQKPVPVTDDHFGNALATIGSEVFVGTPLDDTIQLDAGAVYSFVDTSCGNGVREGAEACDDGNVVDGDGCDSTCTVTGCGNGVLTAGEACDDGNLVVGDGCSPTCTVEGVCGDGVLETFEQCDDSNMVSGDGCDANCTVTGCGNGIVTTGEQCDEGAANGANLCCSVTCQAIDTDFDGVCDVDDNCPTITDPSQLNSDGDVFGNACDVCPGDVDNDTDGDGYCRGSLFNPPAVGGNDPCSRTVLDGAWTIAKARIIRVLTPPEGNEGLRMNGEFRIGSALPIIAPERNGIQMRVTDSANEILFDVNLPGVERVPGGDHGWKASGSPASKWIYTDKRPVTVSKGIKKVTVKDLTRVGKPGMIGIFVAHKGGTIPLREASQLPLRLTVELNDTALPPGGTPGRDQCGEAVFTPSECNVLSTNVLCKHLR
jgi:cysteine-rich repeat protein